MSACVSSSSSFSNHHAKMVAAFDIVSPAKDWRDPIMMSGSQKAFDYVCAHHGVTLDDVIESVEYFTATKASVSTDDYGLLVISAAGYRAGPAGC